jgi:hypothetical protein
MVLIVSASFIVQAADNNDENHYENYSTFKKGKVFSYDPYVWAYTKEFSEKFGMPEKWIDNDLKGMVAVAFRMTTVGTVFCGYGKDKSSCWPPLKCQMDIYYDNSIKLPWAREDIRSDLLQRGLYSTDYLKRSSEKGIRKYPRHQGGFGVLESGGVIQMKKDRGGAASIKYFNRDFIKGIGLVSYTGLGVCPRVISKGYMNIYDKDTAYKLSRGIIRKENSIPMHVFEFSKKFLERANVEYKIKDIDNVKVTKRLLKKFKDSKE